MKHLKNFKLFEESDYDWKTTDSGEKFKDVPLSRSNQWLDKCTKGTWNLDPKSNYINVEGDFDCSFQQLNVFPNGIQFGKISGNFIAFHNNFKDLTGFPRFVKKKFNVDENELTNYEGAPFFVGWSFKSKDIDMRGKQWNAKDVLRESYSAGGDLKNALLTSPFLKAECWNELFKFYPGEGVHLISPVWNEPDFAPVREKVIIPPGFEENLDLFSGLSDVGLF